MSAPHAWRTAIPEVVVIEPHVHHDERGFFCETFNRRDFAALGLDLEIVQDNHARSRRGVLRGLHFQDASAPQGKLVRCTRGLVFDVAVDLRVGAPTFGRWVAEELSEGNMRQLWIPPGFAHGYVVLSETAEVQYKCTGYYEPAAERSLIWNDPDVGIDWPIDAPILSDKDARAPSLAAYLAAPAFRWEG
ncbi:MAG: dTDP-4-dehydrorhamnose 3,5-epimerase [Acidobacteriota bacterium]|nr:MAG: dTDP-4-dehydrorhamnose 3,5-epimerase [Acidobacteriota bacterium]